MEFRELIKARYSVRRFSDRPVEPEKLNAVLEAGRLAPTAKNIQPVRIYVAQSEKALAIMNEASPCIYGAKTVLVICSDESTCWVTPAGKSGGTMDASIVATHITLAAADEGLGSCWVGMFDEKKLSKLLELPENIVPQCLMPIGYADMQPSDRHASRKDLSDTVKYI